MLRNRTAGGRRKPTMLLGFKSGWTRPPIVSLMRAERRTWTKRKFRNRRFCCCWALEFVERDMSGAKATRVGGLADFGFLTNRSSKGVRFPVKRNKQLVCWMLPVALSRALRR